MARIRSVKPSLRTSEVVRQWPFEVRYFWVLLWGYLDDEGRGLDIPRLIAADCYPRDDEITPLKVDRWLTLMARTRRDPGRDPPVCRYTVSNVKYIHAVHWKDDSNQRPNRPTPSRLPQCPIHESLTERRRESLTESPLSPHVLEGEGEGELGGGGAFSEPLTPPPAPSGNGRPPPPRSCPKHPAGTEAPCRACQRAREAYEAWAVEQRQRVAVAAPCPNHRGQLAATCGLCRAERLATGTAAPVGPQSETSRRDTS